MIRKLAVALSLASVLSAGVVQALGLGEASVQSTLNQPLKAEIELVNIRDLEDNEILPGLASREEFLKAGIERVYFLSDVRFEVEHKADGTVVVKLTTNKPVREPFMNFLVEVIWPSGRLLREYALLIDPPIYSEEPLAPVQQAETSPTGVTQAEETTVSTSPDTYSSAPSGSASSGSSTGGTYGPTNNSDTMWAIALKVRPDNSVTAQQTMLAIQELNPDAFINNNINSLKKGQILRLPGLNQIRQLSKRDAVRGVVAQNRSFENKTLSRNVVDAAPEKAASQQALSQVSEASQSARAPDELKLVVAGSSDVDQQSGAHAGESATDGSSSALKNDLAVTLEKLDQSKLEKKELNSRVTDLEEQLETLQRLLTLKDDQLANLQTQMGQEDNTAPAIEVLPNSDMAEGETTVVEGGTESLPVEPAEPLVSESMQSESAPVEASSIEAKPVQTKPVEAKPVEAKPVEVVAVEAKAEEKPLSTQTIIDMVMGNPLYQAAVGGVVLLLLIIVWALSRRNAQKEQEFFETRNDEGEEPGDIFDVAAGESEETIVAVEEGEDESDYETKEVQSETEDVIAEADIYIAYGRLDQASQLLENAISSEPQRVDTRIKLLEVYSESNELDSFNKQFSEVEALDDDYALEQATQIRDRMDGAENVVSIDDLESELLSEEPIEPEESSEDEGYSPIEYDVPETEISEEEVGASDELLNIDEELGDLELELDGVAEVDNSLEDDDLDIDFDINEIDLETDELSELTGDSDGLELSLDEDLSVDLSSEEEQALDGLDLDLSFDENAGEADSDLELELDGEIDLDSELEDLDLDLDLSIDEPQLDVVSEESSVEELSLDEGELSLDDLDLELDKIDSDLDVNFDSEVEVIEPDELEDSEELIELDGDLNLNVESEADDLSVDDLTEDLELDSNSALEELEDIADVLTDESDPSIDDSLLEGAESALAVGDDFEDDLTGDEDFDFLAGTDEAATKLDLARAYIDMGDADGAKDILEEVSLEGNDEQKTEAQDLLKTLD